MDNNRNNNITSSPIPIYPKRLHYLMITKCYAPKLTIEDNKYKKNMKILKL
jgi:hypothetical protein